MADIELVIKIPEEMYKNIDEPCNDEDLLRYIIKHGTPLSKGHGRLIDADEFKYNLENFCSRSMAVSPEWILEGAQTIIEADKIESEDKE